MHNQNSDSSIHEHVQAAIRSGELKAHARSVFVLRIVAAALTAALALVISVITLSFVLYSVIESREAFLLGFGWDGLLLFLILFPWGMILLGIVLLAVFQWQISYITSSYRAPIIPLFVLLLLMSIGAGYLFTPIHATLSDYIEETAIPVLDELYEGVYESHEGYGIYRGIVVSRDASTFSFIRSDGDADTDDTPRLVINKEHHLLNVGDEVFIYGTQADGIIYASQVIALPADESEINTRRGTY